LYLVLRGRKSPATPITGAASDPLLVRVVRAGTVRA
jgi:hypothetical protein